MAISARDWLRDNGYADIADLIDQYISTWKAEGKKTRRNWWDMLAGDAAGRPFTIDGSEFPVLRAAQRRQGKTITKNAVQRSRKERVPRIRPSGRWK